MVIWLCIGNLLLISVVLAVWVLFDSIRRGDRFWLWSLGTLVLAPVLFPVYLGRRPLLAGETREGGTDSNVAFHFSWVYSIFMIAILTWSAVQVFGSDEAVDVLREQEATTISRVLALLGISCCWIVPAGMAFLFSYLAMERDVVEVGGETSTENEAPQD